MKKNGFTLIELLAVIIILGILMIIAIPSVTNYISNSRKSAYVDTAKALISAARNLVNEGSLEMYDTNVTYYIDTKCLETENALKTPYGELTKSFVIVTYNGKGYAYYWTSVDDAGMGFKLITRDDLLSEEKVESDIKESSIETTAGVNWRDYYQEILSSNNCQKGQKKSVSKNINGLNGKRTRISFEIVFDGPAELGEVAHFIADYEGYDGLDYNFFWEYSEDQIVWHRIEGETGPSMDIVMDEITSERWYRAGVTIIKHPDFN